MATPTQIRRRGRFSLILGTLVAALMVAAVAYADDLVYDADVVTASTQTSFALGNRSPGEVINHTIGLRLVCEGKKHADRGTTVTVSQGPASAIPADGALSMSAVVFSIPSTWPEDETGSGTNCSSPPQTLSTTQAVQITAPSSAGSYTFELALQRTVSAGTPGDVKDPNPAKLSFTLTVVANTAPVISSVGNDGPIDEGSSATITVDAFDPDGDTLSYEFDCDDNGSYEVGPQLSNQASCSFDDGPATPTVGVRVTDGNGGSATGSTNVIVWNVAPSATFNTPASDVDEGSTFSLSMSGASDPSTADTTVGFEYKFDCGSGYGSYGPSDNASCTTATDGPASLAIKASIRDKDGGEREYTGSVAVANVAPSFAASYPKFSSSSVACGAGNATLEFNFNDPGADTWTVEIDWDNDGVFEYSRSATKIDSQSHTYSNAGSHTAAVKVTDDDGGSTGVQTATLWVEYNLSAILQPVNNTRNGQPAGLFRYGSTVPVKVEITDCDGTTHPDSLEVRVFHALASTTPPPFAEDTSAPATQPDAGNQMRFSDPIYIFNWSTKKVSDPTCTVRLTVKIFDGGVAKQSTYSDIGLKK